MLWVPRRNKADRGEQPRVRFSGLDGVREQTLQARGPGGPPKEASSEAQEDEGRDGARMEGGGRWSHKAGSPPLLLQHTHPPTPAHNTLGTDLVLEHGATVTECNQNLPDLEARGGNCRGDIDLFEK